MANPPLPHFSFCLLQPGAEHICNADIAFVAWHSEESKLAFATPRSNPELGAFKAIFGLSHRPSFEWRTISYDVTSKTGLSLIGFEVLVLLPVRHELRGETSSNLIDFHHRSMVHAFLHDFPLLCRASEAWFLRGKPQCQGSNGFLWIQETILERQFGSFCVYIWIIVCVYIIYIYNY
jgi:hypothetical protein